MADIQEAINIAQELLKFDSSVIRRNGFLISADPLNTKLIIDNVPSIAGLNITEAIRLEPAILKNNYNSLIEIMRILEVCILLLLEKSSNFVNITDYFITYLLNVYLVGNLAKNRKRVQIF